MKQKSMGFIGGGRITKVILHAFKNKGMALDAVKVYEIRDDIAGKLKEEFPSIEMVESPPSAAGQDIVFIALHPPVISDMLKAIRDGISADTTLISLAPKVGIDTYMSALNTERIIRLIPNATSIIHEGYNPVAFSSSFNAEEKEAFMQFLRVLGNTFEVDERKLESYAVISAMLPTYFWFQWKELEQIGTQIGLSEEESKEAIMNTLLAAVKLFFHPEFNPDTVMDLIPVKPIGDSEQLITNLYQEKLLNLYEKLKR